MQKTLEDEENYDNTSVDMDGVIGGTSPQDKEVAGYHDNAAKAGTSTSEQKVIREQVETSSDEASVTEKHDCDIRTQECQNTQEVEFTSAAHDLGVGGFGSDVGGGGTVPMTEGDAVGTERVLETDSPANVDEHDINLNKSGALAGDTLQFDDDICTIEEGTEIGDTIRTADLLASEVAGSWACSTAPSMYGENESTRSKDNNEGSGALHESNGVVAESQSSPAAAT
ncbi:hypothetical protein RIF29_03643 [Crotalaria pallida]|uniref:Uncharacterized protein n=1 Tax=Crotalaria pallida TaxID=3830 RepID=A0AAN9J0D6_CROPI